LAGIAGGVNCCCGPFIFPEFFWRLANFITVAKSPHHLTPSSGKFWPI